MWRLIWNGKEERECFVSHDLSAYNAKEFGNFNSVFSWHQLHLSLHKSEGNVPQQVIALEQLPSPHIWIKKYKWIWMMTHLNVSQSQQINDIAHNFPLCLTDHIDGWPQPSTICQVLPHSQIIMQDVILHIKESILHLKLFQNFDEIQATIWGWNLLTQFKLLVGRGPFFCLKAW